MYASEELSQKCLNIPGYISNELDTHILHSPIHHNEPGKGILLFEDKFLKIVQEFHLSVQRPSGTFEEEVVDSAIAALAFLPREKCYNCQGQRHLYCGDCNGLRMRNAESLLPSRIFLPFDVLLLLHWLVDLTYLHTCM
jgi:hypothetical protein